MQLTIRVCCYHLLHNVIDRFLKHFAQNATKISLALQIMSCTQSEAVDTHVTAGKEKSF